VIRKAREYYKESNDIEGTLRQLPRHLVAERAVVSCPLSLLCNFSLSDALLVFSDSMKNVAVNF
jgi:tRNA(Glu) U13 pseudouridine synthase TruD